MATIKDVAKEAGVSIATVSYYLNHTKPVSKESAKAIQAAIDKLNYSHNVLARNFRTKRNVDIGVILPDLDDSYYVQVFQGIKSYFRNTDYIIHVEFSKNIPEFELEIAENFLKRQVCGLFLVSCLPNNWKFYYNNFTSKGIPLVLMDRNIHNLDANFICFDNYKLMKMLTERILKKGHREVYLLSGPTEYTCEEDCIKGFTDACKSYGVPVTSDMFIKTDMSKEDAFRKVIKYLEHKNPDAVVATTESLAKGAIEGLSILNTGLKEVPVATFSEEHWNYYTHSFASEFVARTAISLGKKASKLMKEQLENPSATETRKIVLSDCQIQGAPKVSSKGKTQSEGKKKLRVLLLFTSQVEALLPLIHNFENTTGIEVETNVLHYRGYYEEIINNFQEGEPYDVIMYSMSWLPYFASKHMFTDITDEVTKLKKLFFDNILDYFGGYKGQYYGIPFIYGPQFLYYRKDLFEDPLLKAEYEKMSSISLRPPATLKEFNTIADFFSNKTDVVPYGMSVTAEFTDCLVQEIYLRLLAFGGRIFDEQGNVCLDSEQTLKAYINFMRSIKVAKPDYRTEDVATAAVSFVKGETAMLVSYPTVLTDITDFRRNSETGVIGYHMVPGRVPLLGGQGLAISSRSKRKEEAMEFLRWTCNEVVVTYMTLLGGQSAMNRIYTNDALVELYPWLKLYHSVNQSAKAIMPPTLPNGEVIPLHEINDIISKWAYELLNSGMEVQESIKQTHRELEELVEKYMNK